MSVFPCIFSTPHCGIIILFALVAGFPTDRRAFFLHDMFLCTEFTYHRFIFIVRLFVLGLRLLDSFFYTYAFTLCTLSSSLAFNISSICGVASPDRHISKVSFKVCFLFHRSTFLVLVSFIPNTIVSLSRVSRKQLQNRYIIVNVILLHFALFY